MKGRGFGMHSLRALALRKVAASIEELAAQPWSVHCLELLPAGTSDALVEHLLLLGRWERLPWHAIRLFLLGGATQGLDLAHDGAAVEDVDFRATVVEGGCALKALHASSWISDATVFALLRTPVERLQLCGCSQLRLALPPSVRPSACEPVSEHLRVLDISGTTVSDTAMRKLLPGLPMLQTLRASSTRLTPLAFARTRAAAALQQAPEAAAVLPHLRTLELRSCVGFASEPASLAACFPRVEELDLSDALALPSHPARAPLSALRRVREGADVSAPCGLAGALRLWAATLRVLRLRSVHSLSAHSFAGAGELRRLEQLDVRGCARADEAVGALCAPALVGLAVGGGESAKSGERALLALASAGRNGCAAARALALQLSEGALHALLALPARGADACSAAAPGLPPQPPRLDAHAFRSLASLSLTDCGVLSDELAGSLVIACHALCSLELRCTRQQQPPLHADGPGARQLLAAVRHLTVEQLGTRTGAALQLSLPLAVRVRLQLAPSAELCALEAPFCTCLSLACVNALAGTDTPCNGVSAAPPSAHRAKRARLPSVEGEGGACDHRGTLRLPALEQLALSRSEPGAAVALALGALRGSCAGLRVLCVHDCPLGEQHLAALRAPLSGAAARSLCACRLSGSSLPIDDSAAHALCGSGALGDVCLLSRSRAQACRACAPLADAFGDGLHVIHF